MPQYSLSSEKILSQAHPDLQLIFRTALRRGYDHTIAKSYETKEETNKFYDDGLSKIAYPTKHNTKPSSAIDAYPYIKGKAICGANQEELKQVLHFAGYIMSIADELLEEKKITHRIRGGHDWNIDHDVSMKDNPFEDAGHFEIILNPGESFQYFET